MYKQWGISHGAGKKNVNGTVWPVERKGVRVVSEQAGSEKEIGKGLTNLYSITLFNNYENTSVYN
jgi:hypothetical protein